MNIYELTDEDIKLLRFRKSLGFRDKNEMFEMIDNSLEIKDYQNLKSDVLRELLIIEKMNDKLFKFENVNRDDFSNIDNETFDVALIQSSIITHNYNSIKIDENATFEKVLFKTWIEKTDENLEKFNKYIDNNYDGEKIEEFKNELLSRGNHISFDAVIFVVNYMKTNNLITTEKENDDLREYVYKPIKNVSDEEEFSEYLELVRHSPVINHFDNVEKRNPQNLDFNVIKDVIVNKRNISLNDFRDICKSLETETQYSNYNIYTELEVRLLKEDVFRTMRNMVDVITEKINICEKKFDMIKKEKNKEIDKEKRENKNNIKLK